MNKKPKIVCIGGGTGTFTLLSGLKKYPVELAAIVTMADDGGSSGILRDEMGVLPAGDVRQCLVALAQEDLILRKLFTYRFGIGPFLGHNFGNIFMAALEKITGSFELAVEAASKILNVKGKVIPVTLEKVSLVVEFKSGKIVEKQRNIAKLKTLSRDKDKRFYLKPAAVANPKALEAIKEANVIVIGPGDFYCSIIPNLLVKGIPEAIREARALKIYNCNLMTKFGHTDGFRVSDFVQEIEKYLGEKVLDYITYNTKKPSSLLLKKYAKEGEFVEPDEKALKDKRFVGEDLISEKIYKQDPADVFLKRTLIRHDPTKIANLIMRLWRSHKQ